MRTRCGERRWGSGRRSRLLRMGLLQFLDDALQERQRARDYVVHHAARYGWGPPRDGIQVGVILAVRFWELIDEGNHVKRIKELGGATSEQANEWMDRSLRTLAALVAYQARKAYGPKDLIEEWLADPLDADAHFWSEREHIRGLFLLCIRLGVDTREAVEHVVATLGES